MKSREEKRHQEDEMWKKHQEDMMWEKYTQENEAWDNYINEQARGTKPPKTKKSDIASGQAVRAASDTVLRPTVQSSETNRKQKRSQSGHPASGGLPPKGNKATDILHETPSSQLVFLNSPLIKNDLTPPESDVIQPHKMSGYELARYVLDHSSEGVEALIELSNNDESDWLELKAGMELLQEDVKKGLKPDDLYWNIASAVLEIMNTSGGVLIIGIENKSHKVIPLRENDSLHIIEQRGMEAYRRIAILEKIWPSGVKKWSHPKENKTWQIKDVVPENLLEIRGAQYQGEEIAAILIKPALPAIRIWKNDEVEQIRARVPGNIGKVLVIKGGKQMDLYDQNRCVEKESYVALHQRFLEKYKSQSEDARLESKIKKLLIQYNLVPKEGPKTKSK